MGRKSEGIKFHSIYFRYWLFIFAIVNMEIIIIGKDKMIHWDDTPLLPANQLGMYLNLLCVVLFVLCSFAYWKMSVVSDGIYLRKIDLMVPWDEITGASHIWVPDRNATNSRNHTLILEKTIVIYRKDYKPIAVYNISLLALILIKCRAPQIKTNLLSAILANGWNVILNGTLFLFAYVRGFDVPVEVLILWGGLYLIKMTLIPLLLILRENAVNGHHPWLKRIDPSVIHV